MIPSVSVIVPVYGRFNLLKHAVESILAQTCPVSEIILIDDGSIDETPQVLPRYIAEKPAWRERVRYFYQENQGQSVALNNGIARAKGE
ncbi:MAG: glycosyltransferase family A protein, partial [Terriglobia bacterium]